MWGSGDRNLENLVLSNNLHKFKWGCNLLALLRVSLNVATVEQELGHNKAALDLEGVLIFELDVWEVEEQYLGHF